MTTLILKSISSQIDFVETVIELTASLFQLMEGGVEPPHSRVTRNESQTHVFQSSSDRCEVLAGAVGRSVLRPTGAGDGSVSSGRAEVRGPQLRGQAAGGPGDCE